MRYLFTIILFLFNVPVALAQEGGYLPPIPQGQQVYTPPSDHVTTVDLTQHRQMYIGSPSNRTITDGTSGIIGSPKLVQMKPPPGLVDSGPDATIVKLQSDLKKAGYYNGPIDGIPSQSLSAAYKECRQAMFLPKAPSSPAPTCPRRRA